MNQQDKTPWHLDGPYPKRTRRQKIIDGLLWAGAVLLCIASFILLSVPQ